MSHTKPQIQESQKTPKRINGGKKKKGKKRKKESNYNQACHTQITEIQIKDKSTEEQR